MKKIVIALFCILILGAGCSAPMATDGGAIDAPKSMEDESEDAKKRKKYGPRNPNFSEQDNPSAGIKS